MFSKNISKGFTNLELLLAVSIVATIATIASVSFMYYIPHAQSLDAANSINLKKLELSKGIQEGGCGLSGVNSQYKSKYGTIIIEGDFVQRKGQGCLSGCNIQFKFNNTGVSRYLSGKTINLDVRNDVGLVRNTKTTVKDKYIKLDLKQADACDDLNIEAPKHTDGGDIGGNEVGEPNLGGGGPTTPTTPTTPDDGTTTPEGENTDGGDPGGDPGGSTDVDVADMVADVEFKPYSFYTFYSSGGPRKSDQTSGNINHFSHLRSTAVGMYITPNTNTALAKFGLSSGLLTQECGKSRYAACSNANAYTLRNRTLTGGFDGIGEYYMLTPATSYSSQNMAVINKYSPNSVYHSGYSEEQPIFDVKDSSNFVSLSSLALIKLKEGSIDQEFVYITIHDYLKKNHVKSISIKYKGTVKKFHLSHKGVLTRGYSHMNSNADEYIFISTDPNDVQFLRGLLGPVLKSSANWDFLDIDVDIAN